MADPYSHFLDDTAAVSIPRERNTEVDEPTSCFGRFWKKITPKNVIAAVAGAATVAAGALSTYHYIKSGFDLAPTMWLSASMGITAITSLHTGLPAAISDFMARWSFEAGQVETEAFSNALCPLASCQVWNVFNPPELIKYVGTTTFVATASATVALRIRHLLFKEERADELVSLLSRHQKLNPLLFEATTELNRSFLFNQAVKIAVAAVAIALPKANVVPIGFLNDMLLYTGYIVAGSIPASMLAALYVHNERRILKLQEQATNAALISPCCSITLLKRVRQVADIISTIGTGAITVLHSEYSFIGLGFFLGVKKILEQYRFEQLKRNPDKVGPFGWDKVATYAKGLLLAASIAWYTVGLLDSSNSALDRASIGLMYAGGVISYLSQRMLLKRFTPTYGPSYLNSLVFYTTCFPIAIFPYIIRRFMGRVSNNKPTDATIQIVIDLATWFFWGFSWGGERAKYGIREEETPAQITLQQQAWAGKVLASGGDFVF